MRKMSELDRLLELSHDGITVFNFDGKNIPCILFEAEHYDFIISRIAGKPISIDSDLNILQDGLGHVFVEIHLSFSIAEIIEKILVNANKNFAFFEHLAKTSMLAISSPRSHYRNENVFVINFPRPDKARDALEIIQKGLDSGQQN